MSPGKNAMAPHRYETSVPLAPLVDCLALLLFVLSFAQLKAQWQTAQIMLPVVHSGVSAERSTASARDITLIVDDQGRVWHAGQEVSQSLQQLPRGEGVRWRVVGDRRAPYEILARLIAAQPHILLEVSSHTGSSDGTPLKQ
jgi:hypothetical protein